jgi:uncharacterized protein with ATP-grasp and redox domains
MSKIGNFFRGASQVATQVGASAMDSVKNQVAQQVTNNNAANTVGNVGNSVDVGITAGHEIAALMQKLSMAAAEDSATKKCGEQLKSAAQ